VSFDWRQLSVPLHEATHGWLLAGGLQPSNVAEAVSIAQPTGVDVSSGVCGPDGTP
jgi:phosphoribosylanthranilate isomerase